MYILFSIINLLLQKCTEGGTGGGWNWTGIKGSEGHVKGGQRAGGKGADILYFPCILIKSLEGIDGFLFNVNLMRLVF